MTSNLKSLNFKDLIILDDNINVDTYDFDEYLKNGKHQVKGYCIRCEEKGCNTCPTNDSFKLTNISHGASTDDLFAATDNNDQDFVDWHHEGVLFLMEGPSVDGWGLYEVVEYKGHKKRPAQLWYWLHEKHEALIYPSEFRGARYGTLFNSIVFTFKLRNAYLTNLVKCGLNNVDGNFEGFQKYNPETIKTCYENFLTKEIEIIKPKVIFCFGSNVYKYLYQQYSNEKFPWIVISLPHPARGRSGFTDELFRHSYYSMVLEGLYEAGIVSLDEAQSKYGEFLKLSKRSND
jgi:hypothetical protein